MPDYVMDLRKLIGPRMIYVPGVRAIVVDSDGKILLQLRTDTNNWGLPSGSSELEDSVLDTVKREVWEETGLEVLEAEPMGLYSGNDQRVTYPNGDQLQCFSVAFVVRKWSGVAKADGVEGRELGWFAPDKLPEDTVEIHRRTIADYLAWDGKFLLR